IEHRTIDVRDAFYHHVIEDFCASYIKGITPNPCILCNEHIKFAFLMKEAERSGAELIATGHYARIDRPQHRSAAAPQDRDPKRFLLKKGVDLKKDQSYVLYVMKQEELAKTVFPLGEMNKEETRSIARKLGLATALRPESQEICFVGNADYADFIRGFSPDALTPGPVVDINGRTIGEHRGIAHYTIGQRKGLGISSLKPHYVAEIDIDKNTIIAGAREDAMKKSFTVSRLNWISISDLLQPMRADVKIRSTSKERPATIRPGENRTVLVDFDEPQWAPAPGQSAVFYSGDHVIGGGIIEWSA
ncbi:MAG: tRNA 2-thiouridine(34) synthase MnmA, partial [Nitrospirota bacterium]|nr:tRNA 2-thiouridine(34) synthase MnmA [Nitrospirota bacterium]